MLGTLKKIFAFAGNRKGLLKKSLFFSFLNGIFASFQFGALYFIVEALASDNHGLTSVWLALGMMMLSIAGRIFSSFFSMNEQTVVGYGMVADKRISIGDRLRYIPMGYFNKNNIGTITGIVTTTLGDVESSAPVALVNMIGGFFNSVVLILFLLLFNWQLGLVALVGVVCYLLVTEAATRKSTSTAEKRQSAQRGLVEAVLEYIQGMGVVKSFGFEKDSSQSIAAAIRDSNKGNLKLVYVVASYIALQQLIVRIFSTILLILSIYLYTINAFSFVYGILFVVLSFTVFSGEEGFCPSYKIQSNEIVSTVGAGDAFCAGVLYAAHEGLGLKDTLRFANALAHFNLLHATCCGGAPRLKEVYDFIKVNKI